jgi:hypothetical protein
LSLEDRDGDVEVLQPVLAQIAQPGLRLERDGRLGDEHLPTVAGRRDPRGEMDIAADVVAVRHERRARMQTHPDSNRPRRKVLGHLGRGGDRAGGRREGDEERIALCVDLDPAVPGGGPTDHLPVLGESGRVLLGAQLVEQAGRALDVREEERDGAGGQLASHGAEVTDPVPGIRSRPASG